MNGLSHVRKFIRLLSPELQGQIADELAQLSALTESKVQSGTGNETVQTLMKERLDYLKVMNELVGKIQFESLT